RSSFRSGRSIRLADGQSWTFPAPRERVASSLSEGYSAHIAAQFEAEDEAELRRAELAFAIYLLGENYALSPTDYQRLLEFAPDSGDSTVWRNEFHEVAQEHVESFDHIRRVARKTRAVSVRLPTPSRLAGWLRTRMPFRWLFFQSRS